MARPSRSPTRPRWTARAARTARGTSAAAASTCGRRHRRVVAQLLCHRVFAPRGEWQGRGRERGRRRVVDGGRSARRRLCELLRRRRVRGHGCAPAIANAVVATTRATHGAVSRRVPAATLRESSVFGNVAAEWGGGVLAYTQSTLTLTDDTVLYENERSSARRARLRRLDARRRRRRADRATTASVSAARCLNASPTRRLRRKHRRGKQRRAGYRRRGGIAVLVGASAVFQNGAALRANRAERGGGGRDVRGLAPASLSAATPGVSENVAATRGGGVLASRGCVVETEVPLPKRICRPLDFLDPSSSPERRPGGRGAVCPGVFRRRRGARAKHRRRPTPPKPTPPARRLF